ncbi:hypothetical protein BV898_06009 [Hypsibius exemplaris]|uniref:Uncharacterized protein n=1 Tax=Hypsibius exemplaris TaxID=2072580 RepID=A0A1W0WXS3_HYPEX|nr:hypothetical protein BV898_06009 [Hypsibius exemplaris]
MGEGSQGLGTPQLNYLAQYGSNNFAKDAFGFEERTAEQKQEDREFYHALLVIQQRLQLMRDRDGHA